MASNRNAALYRNLDVGAAAMLRSSRVGRICRTDKPGSSNIRERDKGGGQNSKGFCILGTSQATRLLAPRMRKIPNLSPTGQRCCCAAPAGEVADGHDLAL